MHTCSRALLVASSLLTVCAPAVISRTVAGIDVMRAFRPSRGRIGERVLSCVGRSHGGCSGLPRCYGEGIEPPLLLALCRRFTSECTQTDKPRDAPSFLIPDEWLALPEMRGLSAATRKYVTWLDFGNDFIYRRCSNV